MATPTCCVRSFEFHDRKRIVFPFRPSGGSTPESNLFHHALRRRRSVELNFDT